jgi:hypothetical protein
MKAYYKPIADIVKIDVLDVLSLASNVVDTNLQFDNDVKDVMLS